MALLSASQIAQVAYNAGFRGNALTYAVAIALAESGGNTQAHNPGNALDREDSYGLWQINILAHPSYPPNLLYNASYNASAAYQISSKGANWQPWGTYTSGKFKWPQYYNPAVQATQGQSMSQSIALPSAVGGMKPWYMFPRIDNMGYPDSFGGFPKPDSNIQIPTGYPVTALLPGRVTGVNLTDGWGASITILLDTPINALATHTAYIHLRRDVQVSLGQHVQAGQLIAYNGLAQAAGAQKVPLGFALYHGNMYGHDGWQYETYANVTGPLNPVPLLNAAATGKLVIPNSYLFSPGGIEQTGSTPTYTPIAQQVHNTLIETPGFYGIALALDEAEQFPGWVDLTQATYIDTPNLNPLPFGPSTSTQIQIPDFVGLARSIGSTITDNFIPFAIRASLIVLGLILLLALLTKAVEPVARSLIPIAVGSK